MYENFWKKFFVISLIFNELSHKKYNFYKGIVFNGYNFVTIEQQALNDN